MYYELPQWSLGCGYYNGVESTIDITNGLHVVSHVAFQSSVLNFHNFLLNHFAGM